MVGSGPTVRVRRIHPFGCTGNLLELSKLINPRYRKITQIPCSYFPWTAHSFRRADRTGEGEAVGLLSPDRGHTSRSHDAIADRAGRLDALTLGTYGTLEGDHLVVL